MDVKKCRILYVKKYLEEQTDEMHPATIADILTYLSTLGIEAHRRTIMLDIEQLVESGIDIICNRSRQNQYFIGDRVFELPELKLLIDAVQASKFLSIKRSSVLIGKLLSFTSRYQTDLKDSLYLEKQIKPKNEIAYITVDVLLTAIRTNCRVQFMYIEYSPDKRKTYKHGQRVYEFSPWTFVWDNDKYYIIGYSKHHSKAVKFRVDRIAAAKLTGLPAVPPPDDFDLADYVKSIFQMYDGPLLDVILECENTLMKSIIDRFGEDVETRIADKKHFRVMVKVSASKTFYGWVFSSGGAVKIISPVEAVNEYQAMCNRANYYS